MSQHVCVLLNVVFWNMTYVTRIIISISHLLKWKYKCMEYWDVITVIHSQRLAALLFSVLVRTRYVIMISTLQLAVLVFACQCIPYCVFSWLCFAWLRNIDISWPSVYFNLVNHDGNVHCKAHYWSSYTIHIGVDEIGASVKLDNNRFI